jgi:hypothetical protein
MLNFFLLFIAQSLFFSSNFTNSPAPPIDSPGPGTYYTTQTVTISDSTPGATLCYTTSGSPPTAPIAGTCGPGSTTYSGAFSLTPTATLEMLATKAGLQNSAVRTSVYTAAAACPTTVSSMLFWNENDATTGAVGNGNPVGTWYDQSANGYNLTASGAARPTYNSSALHSLPGLIFNGTSNAMSNASFTVTAPEYIIFLGTASGSPQRVVSTTTTYNLRDIYTPTAAQYELVPGNAIQGSTIANFNIVGGFWYSSGNNAINLNGGALSAGSGHGASGTGIEVGSYGGGGQYLNGTLVEIIGYSAIPSTANQQLLEGYLAWKWGLETSSGGVLPSSHPYYTTAPSCGY